jgi:hypothetical protein
VPLVTLGVFVDNFQAEGALDHLIAAGYNYSDISVLLKDQSEENFSSRKGVNLLKELHMGELVGENFGELAALLVSIDVLRRLGIPKDWIRQYEEFLESDGIVVLIWSLKKQQEEIRDILQDHNGYLINSYPLDQEPRQFEQMSTIAHTVSSKKRK